ncbi:AraC family transcriptional regulator [Lachnoclostridium sp.]|nr:AraC family transcriptional regulator [Lachnoclostridium sp.]
MDWLDYMNASLNYIEENLSIKIDYERIAAKALCSSYNFQRMFSFIANVTLAVYIRRRCMTAAALELSKSKVSVLDTAIKYGYDSPVSFARAFTSIHGITPQEARVPGAKLKLYPRISFQISIKGAEVMKYRIEKMDGFCLAGISREISINNGENFKLIPKMWEELNSDGTCDRIVNLNGRKEEAMYGVCYDFHFEEERFRYMIAIKPEGQMPEGYEVLEVPEFTWVKFECIGAAGIQETFQRMNTEWFMTSGYEHEEGPEIEFYPCGDVDAPDYVCEVWVPIRPVKK